MQANDYHGLITIKYYVLGTLYIYGFEDLLFGGALSLLVAKRTFILLMKNNGSNLTFKPCLKQLEKDWGIGNDINRSVESYK